MPILFTHLNKPIVNYFRYSENIFDGKRATAECIDSLFDATHNATVALLTKAQETQKSHTGTPYFVHHTLSCINYNESVIDEGGKNQELPALCNAAIADADKAAELIKNTIFELAKIRQYFSTLHSLREGGYDCKHLLPENVYNAIKTDFTYLRSEECLSTAEKIENAEIVNLHYDHAVFEMLRKRHIWATLL